MEKPWKQWETLFWGGSKITADSDCSHEIKSPLLLWKKSYDQPRQHINKQRHYFVNKGLSSQSRGFSSIHVWMWELDYNENWEPKNWCFRTVVLEKTSESPLHCKEIQPVILKEISPEYSLEGLMLKLGSSNTLVTWCKELIHLKRPCCWERLKAGGEADDRGWNG